jgi:hypothetical protein
VPASSPDSHTVTLSTLVSVSMTSTIRLQSGPFHAPTEERRQLVCTTNLELMGGVLEAQGGPEAIARLDPAPRRCCVLLEL